MYRNYFTGYCYNYPYTMYSPSEIQKTCLTSYKQYLLQLRDCVADYAKQIEEALTTVDKQEAKLRETETEKKEPPKSGKEK